MLVENAIFLIAFRTIFEKLKGAIAPVNPMAARCLVRASPIINRAMGKEMRFQAEVVYEAIIDTLDLQSIQMLAGLLSK